MKIQVFQSSNITSYYRQASQWVRDNINQALDFEFTSFSDQLPIIEYYPGLKGLDFESLKPLATATFNQFAHNRTDLVSFALITGKNQKQLSQVALTADGGYWTILHETAHMIFSYLGLPDRTHEFAEGALRMKELYQLLEPYWGELGDLKMEPLFPLRRRIPIYRAGPEAMRVNPDTRKLFKHGGRDYRALYEPLHAPFDCTLTRSDTRFGGNGLIMDGGEYKFTARHLSKVLKIGEVKRGEQVAITGNTGVLTSGPHLHLEAIYKITGDLLDPDFIKYEEERLMDMILISPDNGPEIALLDNKDVRHPMSERAWVEYTSSGKPLKVTRSEYDSHPRGTSIFFNASFGSTEKYDTTTDEEVWKAETGEVVE